MECVVEYGFSTTPSWIADAVIFTDNGLELNFARLQDLCGDELPKNITISLESSG